MKIVRFIIIFCYYKLVKNENSLTIIKKYQEKIFLKFWKIIKKIYVKKINKKLAKNFANKLL